MKENKGGQDGKQVERAVIHEWRPEPELEASKEGGNRKSLK